MRTDPDGTRPGVDSVRVFLSLRGAVQGVGFRPFVYRLARELHLGGSVLNDGSGVRIDIEGPHSRVDEFRRRLIAEIPPRASIQTLEATLLEPAGLADFRILESSSAALSTAVVMPDLAMCDDCRSEIFDPANRRYRYPFTNCTNCGPRYSIILGLPYDRSRTSMRGFQMCPECQREYADPEDRRFHAQPNACPVCGPHVELWDEQGRVLADRDAALRTAAQAVLEGRIVALKGIGGFQLLVDAGNEQAVQRLRVRKHREEKPLALMVTDIATVRLLCRLTSGEEGTLQSAESPILLLDRAEDSAIAPSVAPGNPSLGVMLPYSPLHALLMDLVRRPVVATSGNRSDEPMCTDEREAVQRLAGIADLFLVHDRPIVRHVDDSVVRWMAGRELVIRRARGFAPLPVVLPSIAERPILCLGAHQKNVVGRVIGDMAILSQHIGDLDTLEARSAFRRVADDLRDLYPSTDGGHVVCDLHPEYASTIEARIRSSEPLYVQHHHAHAAACRAENRLVGSVLAVTWDGTGLGTDGTIWGGEFLVEDGSTARRIASLRTFPLLGGDAVARQPRRSALGLLWELYGEKTFDRIDLEPVRSLGSQERALMRSAFRAGVQVIATSSMGRLFDGVASLLGIRQTASFEGQAAMELEWRATGIATMRSYPFEILSATGSDPERIDWRQVVEGVAQDAIAGLDVREVAAAFHRTVVEMILAIAQRAGQHNITLSGGCFQNRLLVESSVRVLREAGFNVHWHQRIPPNDGGIALGQAMVAMDHFRTRNSVL